MLFQGRCRSVLASATKCVELHRSIELNLFQNLRRDRLVETDPALISFHPHDPAQDLESARPK